MLINKLTERLLISSGETFFIINLEKELNPVTGYVINCTNFNPVGFKLEVSLLVTLKINWQ